MIVARKICTNTEQIQAARMAQSRVMAEDAGEIKEVQRHTKVDVPEPEYDTFSYAFHLRNLVNYYIEEDKGLKDIIFTEAGIGHIRCKYDARIEQQFAMFMNLGL